MFRRARWRSTGSRTSTGTTISFLPDSEIFEEREFSRDTLRQRLRETAFLTRGLRIKLTDEREGEWSEEFHFEGGIKDFVKHVNDGKDPIHGDVIYFEAEDEEGRGSVEIAMQWNGSTSSPSSRSRTTSTRTRAARTSPASPRR